MMPRSARLQEAFRTIARRQPAAPALITDDATLSYAQLDARSDALASELLRRQTARGEAVGVLTERSADLPIAFLAILKAGGVYVPMVADLPAERLANMARQSDMRRLITLDRRAAPAELIATLTANGASSASDALLRPEDFAAARRGAAPLAIAPGDMSELAAILFTSGSTGKPKGVMLTHEACANMALGHIAAHALGSADRVLLSTSPGFILGFRELCLPLMCGASFVPASRSMIDAPDRLLALMARHRVSLAMFTPSYLRLLDGAVPAGLRCLVTAGERPNVADARHYARHLDYWNVHGATEVCGTICMHRVDPDGDGPIPSGRPFVNTAVHLLDDQGKPVADGEVGEIHVVGVGVSRGYLKQDDLSARCFVDTPYGRAYRSFDLARWNADGELETIGRGDDVVKVSGQSVALGEIERSLLRHPAVRRAAVTLRQGALIAWVECPEPASADEVDWRDYLGKTLPAYMIPAQVELIDAMPISSAGKIDRLALLERAAPTLPRARDGDSLPRGELEQQIAGVWQEVIGVRPIGRQDNFFALGGTSLMAIAVSQRLQKLGLPVAVQTILSTLTVAALATQIDTLRGAALAGNDVTSDLALDDGVATADQQAFWVAAQLGLSAASSHIVRVLAVDGMPPDADAWRSAWTLLVAHHPALRTAFYADGETLRWKTVDARQLAGAACFSVDHCATAADARDLVERSARAPFALGQPPLVRAGLIRVSADGETLFWFVLHHAVVDGVSARFLQDDLHTLLAGRTLATTAHGIAVAGRAEQRYLASARVAADRAYWLGRLDALGERESAVFDDHFAPAGRPALPSGRGAPALAEKLEATTVDALSQLAKANGVGLHAVLMTLLASEFRRRARRGTVIIGSGISLRPAGAETAIGHFVNLLPVIVDDDDGAPIATLIRRTQASLTDTIEHGAYPAALLNREFQARHQRSRASPFAVALTAIPPRTSVDQPSGLTLRPRALPGEVEHPAAGLDLLFSHEPSLEDGGLYLRLVWNADVFSPADAASWLAAGAAWARWLAGDATRSEQRIPALLPAEAALLDRWEQGERTPRPHRRVHQLFESLVDRQPNHPALLCHTAPDTHVESGARPDSRVVSFAPQGPRVVSFAQLDARANGIAQLLIALGVVRGSTVAVLAAGPQQIAAAALAVWKAGAAYLPLASEVPAERLAAMVNDAGASALVVLDDLEPPAALVAAVGAWLRYADCTPSGRRPAVDASPDDVAFIIYTSGTTGLPKGVPLTHAGYVNAVLGAAETVGIEAGDRISLVSSVGFDASLWELGHGLLNGITLVAVSRALRDDPWQLKTYYRESGVTIAFHTPSYLRLSELTPFDGLRILLTGGEPPNHDDLRHHGEPIAFWNFYGPTETTIVVAGGLMRGDHPADRPLTVGRPLPNVRISLRDEHGARVAPGMRGEFWLGGSGTAAGYLNRPELSAERFVDTAQGRFYRSGDYGRWTSQGEIEISGRIDDQVKLNGQRVELREIEQTLRSHPEVADAVVLLDRLASGATLLRAFVRGNQEAPSTAPLTSFLSQRLPVHMVPASITPLAAFPLNASGKADRPALLALARDERDQRLGDAPQGPLENRVAAIWSELFGVPVGRDDNFFALGGNSLLAVTLAHQVAQKLGYPIPARTLFAAPTLAAYVGLIEAQATENTPEPFSDAEHSDRATVGEEEFWTAQTAGLDTRAFTIPVHSRVIGRADHALWQRAWSTLVDRHQALRSFFAEDQSGQLIRRVARSLAITVHAAEVPDEDAALAHIRRSQAEPLAMGDAPLWRVGLVTARQEGAQFFWLALHHAIGDGQSVGLLLDELTTLLAGIALPPPADSPRLFAAREQAYLDSEDAGDDARYWCRRLEQTPVAAFAEWPLDRARAANASPGKHRLETRLDARTSSALKALARRHESTLHALMLALLALEARRRSGRSEVLIGTAASLRESLADARIVGYGVNMLPLQLEPAAASSFAELLRATQATLAEALQHARLPFAHLYRAFWKAHPERRDAQRYPLFDLAVTENPGIGDSPVAPRFAPASNATSAISYERNATSPGQDIVLIHGTAADGTLIIQLQLNAAIYSSATARRWFDALLGWADWLGEDPAHAAHALPPLLAHEETQLAAWEHGETIARPALRFHQLFEQQVDRPGQADRPAIVAANGTRTYRELDEDANAIAHTLLRRGVRRGDVVAVLSGRSAQLAAAALGVWKAGATYLPLSTELPPERLAFIVRDATVSQLIALDEVPVPEILADALPGALRPESLSASQRQERRARPGVAGAPTDVAYILYTSGSTGEPKGTLIGHDSYVNLTLGAAQSYGLTPDDRCLMFAAPSFDVSLSDIGVPLASGAAICPVAQTIIESPQRFLDFLREHRVTLADLTPTYLRLFEGGELPPTLRILVTGGEPPTPADVSAYAAKLTYFNAYGPTENTITSSMGRLNANAPGMLSAGRPLPNTSAQICDEQGNALPPGVVGEIWLGGAGLSQGYLKRPELTRTSFVDTTRGRRYRSGDLGCWSADGTLLIIGRDDDQIKLNGIRIEPGEIEQALQSHPAISQAVVLLVEREPGSKGLWAFVRLAPQQAMPGDEEWRSHLAQRLPSHMLPSAVIALEAIPLSVSGKVDRSALLAMLQERPTASGLTLPVDALETQVAQAWSEVLGRAPIHRQDNFFALGGHSLLAISLAHRLEKSLGREVPARELFAEPTLAGFVDRLRVLRPAEPVAEARSDQATVGQREFWTAEQAQLETSGFNIALTLAATGSVPPAAQWRAAWSRLIARHDALRTGFDEDDSGVLRRIVVEHPDASFEILTASCRSDAEADIKWRQSQAFSMRDAGLWRAGLIQIGNGQETLFWLIVHHAVSDGLSLARLVAELSAELRGEAHAAPAWSFDRTAANEAAYLASADASADATYWRQLIDGLVDQVPDALDEWPLDKPRPHARSAASASGSHCWRYRLDASVASGLRRLAERQGASLHALMLTLLGREVFRRTGRRGFLLGTAASTRQSAAEAQTVGYFVNMLPLSCVVAAAEPLGTALRAMQQGLAQALQHARYPFALIYGDFRREHPQATHTGRYPLFDMAVTENPASADDPQSALRLSGLSTLEPGELRYELRANSPPQDLVLIHEAQSDGTLVLSWYAAASIYAPDTAQCWFDALIGWLRWLAQTHRVEDQALPRLLPSEKLTLERWQHGGDRPLPTPSFPDLFAQLAASAPDRPAVITDAGVHSYAAVNAGAERLAGALGELGLARGEAVAVLTERSAALPEAVLGIWKAGCCYLPLTADLPAERLAFMAADAGVRTLVALDGLAIPQQLAERKYAILRPEQLPTPLSAAVRRSPISADEPAYILYTSGSTGVPKGVMLRHDGMLNLGVSGAERLGIAPDDHALLMASPSFDLWISDLVMAWSVGAALVPVRREQLDDIAGMHSLLLRHGVTVATLSPSYLRLFEQADLGPVRILMTVGEPPIADDTRHYAARLACFNGYGPTENTAAATIGRVAAQAEQMTAGRPLANTAVYLVDTDGRAVAPGVAGEIQLAGIGLAEAYLNCPELTAEYFVSIDGERRYRTGDLGRWLADGQLQILGRSDDQVKLHGQRVELGEIEQCLARYPGVQQAAVVVDTRAGQGQRLCAFVALAAPTPSPSPAAWTGHLSQVLPSYMIPSRVQRLATLPLNAAGKIDRRALLDLIAKEAEMIAAGGAAPRTPARNASENRIAQVWEDVLACPPLAGEDDFFQLGGDSLKAIAVINRLRRDYRCLVNDLYENSTLAGFARVCRPRPDLLRETLENVRTQYRHSRAVRAETDAERDEALRPARAAYASRIEAVLAEDLSARTGYRHLLLTGATGYLGSYLLRELLSDRAVTLTALVRGDDDRSARARLGEVLIAYFGVTAGSALRDSDRLQVRASDLREPTLRLAPREYAELAQNIDAIVHCAAKVSHIGHYHDFFADNVAATRHLIALASSRQPAPADFHLVSTLSVAGASAPDDYQLFTEYDFAPQTPDDNYYVRSKQHAEQLVIASRNELANASIHRVGNIGFATDSAKLQLNIADNAFFRQLAAFLRLGAVPAEVSASICHVDRVAQAVVALAGTAALANEIHHIETARDDRLADLIRSSRVAQTKRIVSCDFDEFIERLCDATDDAALASAVAETVDTFGLQSDRPQLARPRRLVMSSERTQMLLGKLGIDWPSPPPAGLDAMLRAALKMP